MTRMNRAVLGCALVFGVSFVVQGSAQSAGGQYAIDRVVIAGGGGPITGGGYQITGTLGQAASSTLTGSSYVVFNGFWAPVGGALGDVIFANGFETN